MAQFSKILYIITQSEMGGAQQYVHDIAQYFKNIGKSVIISSGEDGPLLHYAKKINIQTHVFRNLVREIHPIKDILGLFEIYSYIKKERPEIVHVNSSKAGVLGAIAAKMAGTKRVIFTAHGFVFLEPMPKWKKFFYIWAEKFSSKYKDLIICVSEFDRRKALEYKIAPAEKLIIIHNGIDVNAFQFLSKEEARAYFSKTYNLQLTTYNWIGTIANFYPTKGLEYLIRAAGEVIKKIPNCLFVIIGDGDERKNLENEIKKHGLEKNVFLTGAIKNASQYLKAFDIYICSSVKEGFPYSILEAMAAGLLIISTNVGGIPEALHDESGILIEPKNPKAIADAIFKALSNPMAAEPMASQAKKIIENEFSLSQMLENTARLI